MNTAPLPVRKCRPLCINIDPDAEALLRAMSPHNRAYGSLLSELIRREAADRDKRAELLARLKAEAVQDA